MMKNKYKPNLIVLFILGMTQISRSDIIKVEGSVEIIELPGSSANMYFADQAASLATANPSNKEVLNQAINQAQIATQGIQYTFPFTMYLDLGVNGSVQKYRIEYLNPVVMINDPAFTPQTPILNYNEQITVVFDGKQRCVERYSFERDDVRVETKEATIRDLLEGKINTTQPELIISNFAGYHQYAIQTKTPESTIGEFDVYDMNQSKIWVSKDGQQIKNISEMEGYGSEMLLNKPSDFTYQFLQSLTVKTPNRWIKLLLNNPQVVQDTASESLFMVKESNVEALFVAPNQESEVK